MDSIAPIHEFSPFYSYILSFRLKYFPQSLLRSIQSMYVLPIVYSSVSQFTRGLFETQPVNSDNMSPNGWNN
jgi:hypothetical protein